MSTIQINTSHSLASAQALEQSDVDSRHKTDSTAQVDGIATKPFLNKTVSLLTQGIKFGLSIAIKASLKITKLTAVAAFKVGQAFVAAVKAASENKKTTHALIVKPQTLAKREPTKVSELTQAQRNLALAIRNGQATVDRPNLTQTDHSDIAALEQRARALKKDGILPAKKPNQDYTKFEQSSSRLSANASLSIKDKQDIAALEQRLNALKKT